MEDELKGDDKHDLHAGDRHVMEMVRKSIGKHFPGSIALPSVHSSLARIAYSKRLKALALLASAAIFFTAFLSPAMAGSQEYGAPKVPEFSILANDGQTYSPEYLRGNVVLIMFWATWCPYCKKAMPHMNTFASEYANAPFTLLGICGSKDRDAWQNYIQQHQLQWPQYWDTDLRMAHLFGARGIPNFFLIDKDGYLIAHWVGWDDSLTDRVQKLIAHALAMPRRQ